MKEILAAIVPWIIVPPLALGVWIYAYRRRHQPTPEQVQSAALLGDVRWPRSGIAAVVLVVVYEAAYAFRVLMALPGPVRAALLVPPIVAFVWFTVVWHRESRSDDELERRIQGEASVHAIWMFTTISLGNWLMEEIWLEPHRSAFSPGLGFLPICYVLGLFLAKAELMPGVTSNDAKT